MKRYSIILFALLGMGTIIQAQTPVVTTVEDQHVGGTVALQQVEGRNYKVVATPENGYRFLYWADNEALTSAERSITFGTDAADITYMAVFGRKEDIQKENGQVNVHITDVQNPTFTLTAQPIPCAELIEWTDHTAPLTKTYTESDGTMAPTFKTKEMLHQTDFNEGGTISLQQQECGILLTAVPESGYRFARWENDNTDAERLIEYDVDFAKTTYTAYFVPAQLELSDDIPTGQSLEEAQAAMQATLEAWAGKTTDVIIHRTLWCDGYYNTLCLPFDLASLDGTPLAGGQLMEYTGADVYATTLDVHIQPATSIEAYKPYLISFDLDENITSMTFTDVTIAPYSPVGVQAGEGVNFLATITPTKLANGDKSLLFVAAENTLNWPSEDDQSTMKGFRAYFKVNNTLTAQVIRRGMPAQLVVGSRQTPTGLESLSGLSREGVRKVLHDNRILIIRNGVVYDAIGNKQVK